MNCKHTGCNATEGECSGECMTKAAESFEQMALRVGREIGTLGFGSNTEYEKEEAVAFANALRAELAKQAGSVEPVAWLRFWAGRSYAGNGDIEYADGLEVCEEGKLGDDNQPAFPVVPATALAAQAAKIAELQDEIAKLKPDADRTCTWVFNDNEFSPIWEGSCGAEWTFIEDGPKENEMNYCPQCGAKVAIDAARNAK